MIRLLTTALPAAAAMGALLPGVGVFFGFRIMAVVLAVTAVVATQRSDVRSVTWDAFRLLCCVWITVAVLGYMLSPASPFASRAMLGIVFGMAVCISLVKLSDKLDITLSSLHRGWIIAFVVSVIVAAWELVTGHHLPNFLSSTSDDTRQYIKLIGSLFGNPNAYGAFLVTVAGFLFRATLICRNTFSRLVYVLMVFVCFFFVVASGSRLSLVAFAVQCGAFIMFAAFRPKRVILTIVGTAVIGSITFGSPIFRWAAVNIASKIGSTGPSQMLDEIASTGVSGNTRLNLYLDGLWMVWRNGGLGSGPGGFEETVRSTPMPYPTFGVVQPHNLYIEVLSQYGIVVFALFLLCGGLCIRQCLRALRSRDGDTKIWGFTISVAILGNSIVALANSTYLLGSMNWVFMGTLLVACIMLERRHMFERAALPCEGASDSCASVRLKGHR